MPYRPKLDAERDLKGATPEKLARALFRRTERERPGTRRKPVVDDEVAVEKVAARRGGRQCSASAQAFLSPGRCVCQQIRRRSVADASG